MRHFGGALVILLLLTACNVVVVEPTPVPEPAVRETTIIRAPMPMRQVEGESNAFILNLACGHMMGTVYRLASQHLYPSTMVDDHAFFGQLTEHHRTDVWVSCSFKIEWGEDRDQSRVLFYDYLAITPGEILVRLGEEEFTEPYQYEG